MFAEKDFSNFLKYYLQPGYLFVSQEPHLIHTVLGSCVSICLWDSCKNFGGINHYIYAKATDHKKTCQYGSIAIPYLIKMMLNLGTDLKDLKAQLLGGATNPLLSSTIGPDNIALAETLLAKYRIKIVSQDTGGLAGRKIVFNNINGEVVVYKGVNIRGSDWY